MLNPRNTILTLIDVQEKLTRVMHNRETLVNNLVKLVKGLQLLKIPIIWIEQIPEKMGPTIPELRKLLGEQQALSKTSFSCCGSSEYLRILKESGKPQILIAGIETHVCVYQTAMDLIYNSYDVEVVADATSSRNPVDKETALMKINSGNGIGSGRICYTTTETVLFELMKSAEHPAFREMLKIVK